MVAMLKQLWRDEEAPTAVEYGIMVALIAVVIIAAVQTIGNNLDATFDTVGTTLAGTGG